MAAFAFALDDVDPSDPTSVEVLGAKAAGLAVMRSLGLSVPPAFTLTTATVRAIHDRGWSPGDEDALAGHLRRLRRSAGAPGHGRPLAVSVRAGAARSMPGVLLTRLDVAVEDDDRSGALRRAIDEVIASWDDPATERVRERVGLDGTAMTAVTVQVMVSGRGPSPSGSGVAFSRDPVRGADAVVGDYLPDARGDAVVAGSTPTGVLADLARRDPAAHEALRRGVRALERHHRAPVDVEFTVEAGTLWFLQCRVAAVSAAARARIAVDMATDPDFPFTRAEAIERCRDLLPDDTEGTGGTEGAGGTGGEAPDEASSSPVAPPAMASDAPAEAAATRAAIATGIPASPGIATGRLCVAADRVRALVDAGHDVVLALPETRPSDLPAMQDASGFFTTSGGVVSHAAVVARELGLPAVVGASSATITSSGIRVGETLVREGDTVTVDGDRGELRVGAVAGSARSSEDPARATLRRWAAVEGGATGGDVTDGGATGA